MQLILAVPITATGSAVCTGGTLTTSEFSSLVSGLRQWITSTLTSVVGYHRVLRDFVLLLLDDSEQGDRLLLTRPEQRGLQSTEYIWVGILRLDSA
jgi:hypothetical protein